MVSGNGTAARTATLAPPGGGRRALPPPTSPAGLPARRRWGRVAAGGLLALLGAWAGMVLVATAGGRQERLALATDVAKGDKIERSDIKVVRVAADAGVATVPSIQVVIQPAPSGGTPGKVREVNGWLRDIGDPAEHTDTREASLVVP